MVKQFLIFWLLTTVCTLLSAQSILSGKVTDAISHEPLPFVSVILAKNGVPKWGVQSDFDGQYRLVAMEAGIYDIEFSLISYQKLIRQQVHLIANQSISLDIELKYDTLAAKYPILGGKIPIVQMSNTSILMGRVTMNREPLSAVNVVLLQDGIQVAREMTDVDGLYRMTDLNAGNYDIDFSQIGCQTKRVSNIKIIDNQCFTAHAEMKEDSTFHADFDLGPKWNVKPLDSLQPLKPLALPKTIKFGCGVTSGGHSALFYISSCQMQVNPADTIAYAETPMPIQSLQITNAQGQEMLYRTHLPAGTQKIKVSKWVNGVYDALFKEDEYVFKASFSIIR